MATKHVNLRLEPELHSRLNAIAERNRRSVNAHLIWMMEHDPEFVAEAEKAAASPRPPSPPRWERRGGRSS